MKRQMPSTREIEHEIVGRVKTMFRKDFEMATKEEIYRACAEVVNDVVIDNWLTTQKAFVQQDPKCVYYMSMEFLIGRLLGNNMINMRGYTEVMDALDELGVDINEVEDQEPDPALGNGGLGRLAACFLDSLATLQYPAYGCGIRYHYGMFKQKIEDGYQREVPDNWLQTRYPFELQRTEYEFEVRFGGWVRYDTQPDGTTKYIHEGYNAVIATPYDLPVTGFDNGMVNTLMIWDAKPKEVFRLDSFEKGDYNRAVEDMNLARNLTEVLYPNDNHIQGKELRLKQQYFFVSASIQRALAKYLRYHKDIKKLPEKVVFQMNDTHPTLTVAELMRILMDVHGLGWDEAWEITTHCVAYTNHTIMSEALEKWPQDIFKRLLPRVFMIVEEINRRFCDEIRAKFPGDEERVHRMAILADDQVKMAHMAIAASYSVNGVAALHTEILKNVSLHDFYEMYPEKFNNKTNGITQRRFLMHGNYKLSDWVIKKIGRGWITDLSQMKKLESFVDDKKSLDEFMDIKLDNKKRLAKYILEHNGIEVDPNSIFDVQVKRLHEYKRQLLNILHVMYLYNQIKENPEMDFYPTTFIFGAKASAGYENAKLIIKLINNVAAVINNDKSIDDKIKVVFIEDYRVSNAEWIFAAADVSEQISTASKEASGTGNMKFMLNGAVTVGTMDGANVEMYQELGGENIFIFGMSSDEVIAHEKNNDYNPVDVMNGNHHIQKVLQQLVNGNYSIDNPELFRPLYNSLLNTQCTAKADTYFVLKDFASYCETHEKIQEAYKDKYKWAKMALENVAHVGKFSSDRTIQEYVDDIWHLDKLDLK